MLQRRQLVGCLAAILLGLGANPAQAQYYNPYFSPNMNQAQWYYNMQARNAAAYNAAAYNAGAYNYGMYNPAMGYNLNPYTSGINPYTTTPYGTGYNPYVPTGPGAGMNPYTPYSPGTPGMTNPYSPTPYPYPDYTAYDPYGLRGQADTMRAFGQLINQEEQARILREQALQARVDTAKKKFDYQMYVKANTPTFTQEQAKVARDTLRRIQTNSNPAEISSGKALNVLLDDIRTHPNKKVSMDPIPLSEDVLKSINVIKNAGNLGLLRDDAKFNWPVAFLDVLSPDEQRKIELTTQTLLHRAFKEQLDANLVKELTNLLNNTRDKLAKKVNDIPTTQYLEAKRFLNDFDDARIALERGEAPVYQEYKKFIAKGRTVQELVDYLITNGLKLAPATTRDEGAYRALYSAMVAFDVAMNTGGMIENKE
jgi:hypothetical protein